MYSPQGFLYILKKLATYVAMQLRIVSIVDVPPIVYSGVITDMEALKAIAKMS
jgi:hypothetical protein